MTRALVLAALVAVAPSVGAQVRDQPTLIFTIYGGTAAGHHLWTIANQPLPPRDTFPDTATISRRLDSGLAVGLMATLFPSARLGVQGEVAFRTFGLDDSCAPAAPFKPDRAQRNRVLCDNITASANSGSVLTVHLGATFRPLPRGAVSPYLRASAALSHMAISTIAVVEQEPVDTLGTQFLDRALILDDVPRTTSLAATLGGGFTFQVSPGYQFRLEVRDDIRTLERITGPASPLAVAPTEVSLFHHMVLLFGLDIVLEQKRGRRY